MRILYLTHTYPSQCSPHITPFVKDLAEKVGAEPGVECRVHVPWCEGLGGEHAQLHTFRVRSENRIPHKRIGKCHRNVPVRDQFEYLRCSVGSVTRLLRAEPFDLLHAHWALPSGLVAMVASLISGVPYVVTCHGRDVLADRDSDYAVTVNPLLRRLTRVVLERAQYSLASSETVRKAIVRVAPLARVATARQGIGDEFIRAVEEPAERTIDLLFVGDLIPRKGIDTLARAIERSPRLQAARVAVVGVGPEVDRFRRLSDVCRELELRVLGAVPPAEVSRLLARAKILAFPSHIEAFGIIVLEALAMGAAVVGSHTGVLGDLALDGRFEPALKVVSPRDSQALAEALERSLEEVGVRELPRAVQSAIRREFGWWTISRDYIALYRSVLAGG